MPVMDIEFVSSVAASYRVEDDWIRPGPGPRRQINPFAFHEELYTQFARLEDEPDAFCEFIASFGPVTRFGEKSGERLDVLIAMRRQMAGYIELANQGADLSRLPGWIGEGWMRDFVLRGESPASFDPWAAAILTPASSIRAILQRSKPDGRLLLAFVPDSLWDGIKLQLWQAVSSGARIKKCQWCGGWFEAGGTGRRVDAKFCSDDCRKKAHVHAKEVRQ